MFSQGKAATRSVVGGGQVRHKTEEPNAQHELTLSVGLGALLDEMHRVLGELLQRSNQKLVDIRHDELLFCAMLSFSVMGGCSVMLRLWLKQCDALSWRILGEVSILFPFTKCLLVI